MVGYKRDGCEVDSMDTKFMRLKKLESIDSWLVAERVSRSGEVISIGSMGRSSIRGYAAGNNSSEVGIFFKGCSSVSSTSKKAEGVGLGSGGGGGGRGHYIFCLNLFIGR
jgi:hypothetical protein